VFVKKNAFALKQWRTNCLDFLFNGRQICLLNIRCLLIIGNTWINFTFVIALGRDLMMYRIAELNVSISGGGALFSERAEAYCTENANAADIVIDVPQDLLQRMRFHLPQLTEDECAYIYTGEEFCYNLIIHEGFRLHASAVVLDGQAYLFSAPSGTGKSTHTALWCDYFGPERAYILNDDAPVIKLSGETFFAWGSPWSGTSPLNRNSSVPLKAIAFLERSGSNWIRPMPCGESIVRLMEQTRRTQEPIHLERLISLLEKLMKSVPIYRMGCTISHVAVETAYAAMNR
jgi:hypothetical protein